MRTPALSTPPCTPAGTGKTYTAVLLVDALLRRSSQTILMVSYTNHALDQAREQRAPMTVWCYPFPWLLSYCTAGSSQQYP